MPTWQKLHLTAVEIRNIGLALILMLGVVGLIVSLFAELEMHDQYGLWNPLTYRSLSDEQLAQMRADRVSDEQRRVELKFQADVEQFLAKKATYDYASGLLNVEDVDYDIDPGHPQGSRRVRNAAFERISGRYPVLDQTCSTKYHCIVSYDLLHPLSK